MPRLLIFLSVFALLCLRVEAGSILTINIDGAEIKLPNPRGMVDVPKDSPLQKAVVDLVPPTAVLLRCSVSAEALDDTKPADPSKDMLMSQIFALKDHPEDIGDGNFIDIVQLVAIHASHGVLLSQDSSFDYVETQKRLDDFQKDTGVQVQGDGDVYSLGIISRSDDCVAYLAAQYVTAQVNGKDQRLKCLNVIAFLHLKQKVLIAVTSLTKATILHDDILTVKHTAEKYQNEVREINNTWATIVP